MSKELEEVKKYLEQEIKVYENNKEINRIIGGKFGEKQHEINKILLNYIDNSIPKKVVEEKIEYYKNLIEECKNDEEHYGEIYLYKIYIDALQELLEGK